MAEKIVLCNESDLVSVADAIREKAGLEDNFAFPEGFAEAIAGIEAGGGGLKVEVGTITLAENTNTAVITHNFGSIPKMILFGNLGTGATNSISSDRSKLSFIVFSEWFMNDPLRTKNLGVLGLASGSSYSLTWYAYGNNYSNNSYVTANAEKVQIGGASVSRDYEMDAGDTYIYIFIG